MSKIVKHIIIFALLLAARAQLVQAQPVDFDYSHEGFGIDVKDKLSLTGDPVAASVGEAFTVAWSALGGDVRRKIVTQVQAMVAAGQPLQPGLEAYFAMIGSAYSQQGIRMQEMVDLLNMTGKVIEQADNKAETKYFQRLQLFFETGRLFSGHGLQLLARNYHYRFDYAEPPEVAPEEPAEDEYDEEYAEDDYEEDDWQEEDWTEEEEYEEEETVSLADLLEEEEPVRPVIGASLQFDKLELVVAGLRDSLVISAATGAWLVQDQVFIGNSGRINWPEDCFPGTRTYVALGNYEITLSEPELVLAGVKLHFTPLIEQPVKGEVRFRALDKTPDEPVYPQFVSFENNIKINGLAGPYTYYTGGLTLRGCSMSSESKYRGKSVLRVEAAGRPKFTVSSLKMTFGDSIMYTARGKLSIYTKYDSIYHPAVQVHYDMANRKLLVQKDEGEFRNTPFLASANNLSFTADIIQWQIDSDSLFISTLLARKDVPLIFLSNEYYDKNVFSDVAGLYNFNPLKLVLYYAQKEGVDEFYLGSLADDRNIDVKILEGAIMALYQKGYVEYDPFTGLIRLTPKGLHKGLAQKGKADYDNIMLLSLASSGANAIYNLNTQEFEVYGVDKFYLSKELDVSVTPDSSRISLLPDLNIKFNGTLAAGNFDYKGRDFIFRYDSFLVEMNQIDAIDLYVQEETDRGTKRKKINNSLSGIPQGGLQQQKEDSRTADSTAFDTTQPPERQENTVASMPMSGTSGILYISKPKNKSGRKLIPNYPKFKGGGTGSVVYFDQPDILGGVYDRSMYFTLPPFDLDSLNDSDPSAIKFSGTFHSDGWFPEFKENLHIMPDYSLGFDHGIPPEGYQLFGGNGRLYNRLTMDTHGLVGHGRLEFLTTTMVSDNFVFYPDSVVANGVSFEMREEEFGGIRYPQIMADNFHLRWLPRKDSMYVSNIGTPFAMYNGRATLDGTVVVTNQGVKGMGLLATSNATTQSKDFTFNPSDYEARHALFEIKSDNPDKPALRGTDVRIAFDLSTNQADISPEVEGVAAIDFPYAQFKTSITNARWNLDSQKVYMSKPPDVDIKSSYFYTTRPDLDSLNFNATYAEYDMRNLTLKVGGIPYIKVADALITPENGEVTILENSRIGTLHNTTIKLDTLTGYHQLYDATVTIISRNEFEGEGTYRFINAVQDTFAIKLHDFHLEDFNDGRRKRQDLHTVATGEVKEEDNLLISPGMYYKGNVKMIAHKPALELDGYVKLDLKSLKDYDTWIKYKSKAEQQEVTFKFDESVTAQGRKLTAGLHFDHRDYSLYSTFCYDKRDEADEDFFKPSGYLSFKADSNEFIIINLDKDLGLSYSGKVFAYNESTQGIRFEGPVHFMENSATRGIVASAIGTGNMQTNELEFVSFLTMDFKIPSAIYQMMANDFVQIIDEFGAPEAIEDRTNLLYLMAEIIGNRATKAYEERSASDYVPLASASPNLVRPFVFPNIHFKWSEDQRAFYNTDGRIAISNILRTDINAEFEGFLEIRKTEDGEIINLFIKAAPESWYYFSYENNKLFIFSSNKELNTFVKEKTNIGKTKIGEFQFAPSDLGETLEFIQTFRALYYDIDEPYDLQGDVVMEEQQGEEADEDDDGF